LERRRQFFPVFGLALAILVGGGILVAAGWYLLEGRLRGPDAGSSPTAAAPLTLEEEQDIRTFCSACHAFPLPETLPRSIWKEEVEKMYELVGAEEEISGFPPIERTLHYYLSGAPEALPPPESYGDPGSGPLRFQASGYQSPWPTRIPAISYLKHVRFLDDRHLDLIICDMRFGLVLVRRLYLPDQPLQFLAKLSHPAHVEVVDLDQDGLLDLLVAELGSFGPADHDRGEVVWLRGRPVGPLETIRLLQKVGRVADVQAADVDADGDLDLAVAVFGWRSTGKVVLLENRGEKDERGVPRFVERVLDARPGAINVPFVDLDRDGRLDIIVLLSQHFETVVAYLNDGKGWFEPKTIYEAPHPDWGSAGIEVVDLDADGDLDVLLVSGDTLDTNILKPHQGVQWLENEGSFPFRVHHLASLAGAHKVRAADLDGDGDLDLAAASFLPQVHWESELADRPLDSVLWIEQVSPGQFQPHALETVTCDHASLEVGDFDEDGDVDLVIGNFFVKKKPEGVVDWLTFFTNLGGS
jgi:hypothetical protein